MKPLYEIFRVKLLEILHSLKGDAEYTVLVLDNHTLPLITSNIKMDNILDIVTLTEQIEKQREPLTKFDVIYFINPDCQESVKNMIADFNPQLMKERMSIAIKALHDSDEVSDVLFSKNKISNSLAKLLAKRDMKKRIKHILEANSKCDRMYNRISVVFSREVSADFVSNHLITTENAEWCRRLREAWFSLNLSAYRCFDRHTFTLKERNVFTKMYLSSTNHDEFIEHHVSSLLSFVKSIGVKTSSVRFNKSNGICKGIGEDLFVKLKNVKMTGSSSSHLNILILDRSVDFPSIFLHSFHYESFLLDVLCDNNTNVPLFWDKAPLDLAEGETNQNLTFPLYQYTDVESGVESTHILNEQYDYVYGDFKNLHIVSVKEKIIKSVGEIDENYKNIQSTLEKGNGSRSALSAIPEYRDSIRKYSVHSDLISHIFSKIEEDDMFKIVNYELCIATGVDDNGKRIQKWEEFIEEIQKEVLSSVVVPNELKCRLILLILGCIENIDEKYGNYLVTSANLPEVYQKFIVRFLLCGFQQKQEQGNKHNKGELTHIYTNRKKRIKHLKSLAKNAPYTHDRYESELVDIVYSWLNDYSGHTISQSEFQQTYVLTGGGSESHGDIQNDYKTQNNSILSTNANTNIFGLTEDDFNYNASEEILSSISPTPKNRKSIASLKSNSSTDQGDQSDQIKYLVFVVGGVTLSEISALSKFGVYIGGSNILTTKRLLDMVE